ncbi:MAG: hypothetical protein ACK53H_05990 [Betaproteobacteria bacterium]|jgi:hypothetical protein
MTRFVLGVLLCALAYPGAILVLAGEHWAAATSAFMAGVFTVAGSVLLALLILAVFRRRGWLRWWQLVAGGALIGGVLPFLSFPLSGTTVDPGAAPDIRFALLLFAWFAALGAIHALALWAIAVVGNPWCCVDAGTRLNDT